MGTTETVQRTLADLLAEALAEQDDGNISEAARKMDVSRGTVYGWLDGVVPQRDRHIEAIIAYTGYDEIEVLLAIRLSRKRRDDRATLLRASDEDDGPGPMTREPLTGSPFAAPLDLAA